MALKDPLSGLLHLVGAVLAIPATVLLILLGAPSTWKIVAFSVYGLCLFLLFLFSTLYHWLPNGAGGRFQVFRKLDHLAIYALIAGSYTPFCLVTLRGPWGWSLFGVIWGIAIAGIGIQAFFINAPRLLTTSLYLIMGWCIVVAVKPLITALQPGGVGLLLLGGIIYSLGGVVYVLKKPNFTKAFGFHELWHITVLGGAICHYLAMLFFVA